VNIHRVTNTTQTLIMEVDAVKFRAYTDAIKRIDMLLSLASMIPILFASRYGSRARGAHILPEPEADQADQTGNAKNAEQQPRPRKDTRARSLPLGVPSLLLLALAEVIACRSTVLPESWLDQGNKPKAKSKTKDKPNTDIPFKQFLKGIGKGRRRIEKKGSEEGLAWMVQEALGSIDAWGAVHGLAMIGALIATAVSLLGHHASAAMSQKGGKILSLVEPLIILLLACLFATLRSATLQKTFKLMMSDGVLDVLRIPLRTIGLFLANPPEDKDNGNDAQVVGPASASTQGGTPSAFAMFQVASLAAAISAVIAGGETAQGVAKLSGKTWADFLSGAVWTDNVLIGSMLPLALAMMWLAGQHLRHAPGLLILASSMSIIASPVALTTAIPLVANALGIQWKDHAHLAKIMSNWLSLAYAMTVGSLILSGGTLCLLAGMLVLQILVRVHGPEVFSLAMN